ncbi:MAG: M16 family metallopeptidase [Gammaproteobacteria bacterium]
MKKICNPYKFGAVLAFVLLAVGNVVVIAGEQGARVHERKLSNGLKILVKEDHRSPVVVSQIWYKVGSSYEHDGITGISHMLEHMMFKGTKKHPPGEFSRIIAENGGNENAFTGQDYTAYFQTLEKSRLPISFELEADRMRRLNLTKDELDKELQVVLEERRMRTDDKPRAKTGEFFMAMAYVSSPYKNPIIGWPVDIENYRIDDLEAWYRQWYAPNNATLVIVGDVVPEKVFQLADKHFGSLKPSNIKPLKPRDEVEQVGERRMTVKLPAKLPYLVMGYKVPVLNSAENEWEAYALEVLAAVLDGGDSARLQTRLVRGKQIAVSAGAGYSMYSRLPTLFTLDATPAEGKNVAELESALKEEIRKLQSAPVAQDELDRIKAQVLAQSIYERDSMFYQGMQLGILETVGVGWQKADEYVNKINQVTAEQVQMVAGKYLVEDKLNVAVLDPQPIVNHKPQSIAGGRHAQ